MPERIIITLTTWSARIGNIPAVLDTIFNQTLPPDKVVLNVAHQLDIPQDVQDYLDGHNVEVFRCPDTKVYKKLILTLKRYSDDCVISIDDDWLYPKGMIADFMEMHKKYPEYPISGNKVVMYGMQCHCGCASLTKAEYLGEYLNLIDDEIISTCASDDMVYTYLSNKNGHPYLRSNGEYFENMESYCADVPYSNNFDYSPIKHTHDYLTKRFGPLGPSIKHYIPDETMASMVYEIGKNIAEEKCRDAVLCAEKRVRSTLSYRLGKTLLFPFSKIRNLFNK